MNQKKFFIILTILIIAFMPPFSVFTAYLLYSFVSIDIFSVDGQIILLMFLITSLLFFIFRYLLIKSLRIKFSQEENVTSLSLKDLKNKQTIKKEDSVIMLYLFYCFFKFFFILFGFFSILVLL